MLGDGGWGGVKNVEKPTPFFFWSKSMNPLVFFLFSGEKVFRSPTPWGLYGAEWDELSCSLCTFQPYLLCLGFW